MDSMKELQDRWAAGQLIGLDIVYCGGAAVKNIDIASIENDRLTHAFGREYRISYEGEAELNELLGDDDVWSEVQVYNKLSLEGGRVILCGEGEMGNEGFIARTDKDNNIEWFLFSTTSNPFVDIRRQGDFVYIHSTHRFCIALNLLSDEVFIVNEDFSTLGAV